MIKAYEGEGTGQNDQTWIYVVFDSALALLNIWYRSIPIPNHPIHWPLGAPYALIQQTQRKQRWATELCADLNRLRSIRVFTRNYDFPFHLRLRRRRRRRSARLLMVLHHRTVLPKEKWESFVCLWLPKLQIDPTTTVCSEYIAPNGTTTSAIMFWYSLAVGFHSCSNRVRQNFESLANCYCWM